MSREGTRDLAWWRIPSWTSAVPRVITTGVVFGLVFALGGSPVYGLVGGPVTAYFYMLVQKNYPPVRRAPLQWRHLLSRNSLVPGLQYALVAGALCGLFGLAARVGAGRTAALVAGIGIGIGLAGALTTGLARSATDNANPLTPRASWRSVQAFGLAVGLTLGLGLILGIGLGVGFILALGLGNHAWHVAGIVSGLVWVLGFGLVFGLVFPRTWAVSLTFAQLAMRWHTPARLLRFLDDARQRNVLRTVGPVYQFRHARLQDRLAGQAAPK
jgi:MFS family permease